MRNAGPASLGADKGFFTRVFVDHVRHTSGPSACDDAEDDPGSEMAY